MRNDLCKKLVAKTDASDENAYLPLATHLRDTAAVMRELVQNWLAEGFVAATGMTRAQLLAVMVFLAAIHDIGKATAAFVRKLLANFPRLLDWLAEMDLSATHPPNSARTHHTVLGAAILARLGAPDWVRSVVGAHHGKTLGLNFDSGEILDGEGDGLYGLKNDPQLWEAAWQEIFDDALAAAGLDSVEELPQTLSQPVQVLLTGLLIMADWLASNTENFPLLDAESPDEPPYDQRLRRALERIHLSPPWRADESWQYDDLGITRFGFLESNAVQRAVQRIAGAAERPGLMIVEAPMGEGKTEAALMAAEIFASRAGEGGLAFFLPSQATANAMYDRIVDWIWSLPGDQECWFDGAQELDGPLSITLAHGKAALNEKFAQLAERAADIGEDDDGLTTNAFFMGRKTQLLADFVVGTVDQLLMGALKQKHIMLRFLGLAGKTVVVDEVHAYDAHMNVYMDTMLSWLGALGVPVVLLSATLPGRRRGELAAAYLGNKRFEGREALQSERAYPLLTWTDGEGVHSRTVERSPRQTEVEIQRGRDDGAEDFLGERLAQGGCAGVIVNTVRRAQEMARRLSQAFPDCEVLLDHAQFILPDRVRREETLLERLGKGSTASQRDRLIVVGTQVLEASLDLDFDVMVTDLAPMDALLQRLGRLHRRPDRVRPEKLRKAACLVLCPDELEDGAKAIYGPYLLRKTLRLLPDEIRLPQDISPLVQAVYDSAQAELPELEMEREKYENEIALRARTAEQTCIGWAKRKIGRHSSTRVINGLTEQAENFSDEQIQTAVRDGAVSVEVLALRDGGDGLLVPVVQGEGPVSVSPSAAPSREEAKVLLRQSLRLPYRFSLPGVCDRAIDELEAVRRTKLAEWARSPRLGRELFLLLDAQNCATLAGMKLRYDERYGLCVEKEEENGEGV